ncbi:MAG: C-GCAxxG-C-C family protein [Lachnospiraceae bacterium]|nr:C-GCAxxG-C-C family protein [Lachnospiraceae bacterium]
MSDHAESAKALFLKGYNCSQAVLCAFEDVTGFDRDTAARLSSSFGGGMGRMREVCGAVSGALMVLGIARGYSEPTDNEAKKRHYALVQDFAARFREKNGSIICRELLGEAKTAPNPEPEKRTAEYYKKRPCPELVYEAARIVEEMLEL